MHERLIRRKLCFWNLLPNVNDACLAQNSSKVEFSVEFSGLVRFLPLRPQRVMSLKEVHWICVMWRWLTRTTLHNIPLTLNVQALGDRWSIAWSFEKSVFLFLLYILSVCFVWEHEIIVQRSKTLSQRFLYHFPIKVCTEKPAIYIFKFLRLANILITIRLYSSSSLLLSLFCVSRWFVSFGMPMVIISPYSTLSLLSLSFFRSIFLRFVPPSPSLSFSFIFYLSPSRYVSFLFSLDLLVFRFVSEESSWRHFDRSLLRSDSFPRTLHACKLISNRRMIDYTFRANRTRNFINLARLISVHGSLVGRIRLYIHTSFVYSLCTLY